MKRDFLQVETVDDMVLVMEGCSKVHTPIIRMWQSSLVASLAALPLAILLLQVSFPSLRSIFDLSPFSSLTIIFECEVSTIGLNRKPISPNLLPVFSSLSQLRSLLPLSVSKCVYTRRCLSTKKKIESFIESTE